MPTSGTIFRVAVLGAPLAAALAACGGAGARGADAGRGAGAGPDAAGDPETGIVAAPPAIDESRSARFEVRAWPDGAAFECSLDGAAFAPCQSPVEIEDLVRARHRFEARATFGGSADATPAAHEWDVVSRADFPDLAVVTADPDLWVGGPAGARFLEQRAVPRQMQALFAERPDDFDSVIGLSAFPYAIPQALGFGIPRGVRGTGAEAQEQFGRDVLDSSGSERLQHFAWMIDMLVLSEDPREPWGGRTGNPTFQGSALDVLAQEFGHMWGVALRVPGKDPYALLDPGPVGHWNLGVALDAQSPLALGGGVSDHGDGTFTTGPVGTPAIYSSLDLYVMGLLPAESVPPLFYVRDRSGYQPSLDGNGRPWTVDTLATVQVRYRGERVDVGIDDVVKANGPRDPPAGEAQTAFRQAFVLVVWPDVEPDPALIEKVDRLRREWEAAFALMTRGLGCIDTSLRRPPGAGPACKPTSGP